MIEQSIRDNILAEVYKYIDNYDDDDDDFVRIFGAERNDSVEQIEAEIKNARENAEKIVNSSEFKEKFCGFWNDTDKVSSLKELANLVEKLLLGSSLAAVLQTSIITLPVIGISFSSLLAAPVIWAVVLFLSGYGVKSYCGKTKNQ